MDKVYGNAVAIDGSEVSISIALDTSEVSMSDTAGGDLGVFYPVGGATSYDQLTDKPSINGYTIIGDKLGEDYNLQDKITLADKHDIDKIFFGV